MLVFRFPYCVLLSMMIAALPIVSMPAPASGQVASEQVGPGDYKWDEVLNDSSAGFRRRLERYRAHVRVRLGPERRLSNGVAWRLFIDAATGLAMPRITWMPDRLAMRTANRIFDGLQGADSIIYASLAAEWQEIYEEAAQEDKKAGPGMSFMIPRDHFTWQEMVALTYATSRFVSYFAVYEQATTGMSKRPRPHGWIIDLEKGKRLFMATCQQEDGSPSPDWLGQGMKFRVEGFLEVCDTESVTAFVALYNKHLELATKSAAFRHDPYAEYCKEELVPLALLDPAGWYLAVYLTVKGLAVHLSEFSSHAGRNCLRQASAVIPVIIPYRELEPFMKSGPLRDELLHQ